MHARFLKFDTPVKLLGYFVLGTFFAEIEIMVFAQFFITPPDYFEKTFAVFTSLFLFNSLLYFVLVKLLNKQMYQVLKRYRTLVDNLSIGIYRNTPGPTGRFLEANAAIISMFEASSREEFLRHNVSELYQDPKRRELFVEKIMKTGSVKNEELALVTLKGKKFIGSVTAIIERDADGMMYIDGFIEDITERKRSERVLETYRQDLENKVSERTRDLELAQKRASDITEDLRKEKKSAEEDGARDEAILQAIGEGLIVTNHTGVIIKVNRVFEKLLGWTEKEVVGQKLTDMIPMENSLGVRMSFEERMVTQILTEHPSEKILPVEEDVYYVRKDKSRFPVSVLLSPVLLNGKILGAVAVFHDMTREKALDRSKSEFISIASHQLRTPLASTKWALDLFIEDEGAHTKYKKRLNDLYLSNERLIQLVNSLLEISRLETGQVHNKVSVNLLELADNVCGELEPFAKKKNQSINIIFAPEIKTVTLDVVLFHEVIKNLVGNAIDYGFVDTVITLSAQQKANAYEIAVHSVGKVIHEEEWVKLFTKFYRGKEAQGMKPVGSGLGLYIAKTVVEANGGKIWFTSSSDKGTTFYFTIPKEY